MMLNTLVIKVDPKRPDKRSLEMAARVLKDGGLVAFPTETVYGLGANLFDEKAIERLNEVKNRPRDKRYTVHIASLKTIEDLGCEIGEEAKSLISKYWPGPLTIILPVGHDGRWTMDDSEIGSGPASLRATSDERRAMINSIGFRMPDHKVALDLIRYSGVPVVAPSANVSGDPASTSADDVLKSFDGKIEIVLDAGPTTTGVESTVVNMTEIPYKVVRRGAIKL